MHTISLILHVLAAAVIVGPQVIMFYAVVPATWLIENDEKLKHDVTRVVTGRFAQLTMIAFLVLIVTGVYQYIEVPADFRHESEFASVFGMKMLLVIALVGMTVWHVYKYGRRIAALSDDVIAGRGGQEARDDLERTRQQSFGFSALIMIVTVGVVVLGVMLSTIA